MKVAGRLCVHAARTVICAVNMKRRRAISLAAQPAVKERPEADLKKANAPPLSMPGTPGVAHQVR